MNEPFMPPADDASQPDTLRRAPQPEQASPPAASPAPPFRDYVQGDLVLRDKNVFIGADAAAARRTWLEHLAAYYDVAMPAPASTMHKVSLNDLDATYVRQLRTQHGFTPAQVKCHLTHVRVKLFEWVDRESDLRFAMQDDLTDDSTQAAVACILTPLLELHVYDDMLPYTTAVLACLTSPALAALMQTHRVAYVQAVKQNDVIACLDVVTTLAYELGDPRYYDGIRNLLAYLLDERRWRRGLAEYAQFKAVQGRFVAPLAAWYGRTPGPQRQDGSRFLFLLLAVSTGALAGVAASGVTAAMVTDLLMHGDHALLRQVWRHLTTPAPAGTAPTTAGASPVAPAEPAEQPTSTPSKQRLSIPVTAAEWRTEVQRRNRNFGHPAGYFCYVRPGTYTIGGWEKGEPGARIALREFWVATAPITNAQFAPFVRVGYANAAQRWWTANGWTWRTKEKHTQPLKWNQAPFNRPQQPVIGTTWYEATAFCARLHEQLGDALPDGYVLRLPTEAEWEAAAAYDMDMHRHSYPWGDDAPTPERAVYEQPWEQGPPTVGSRPAGAAACGALDMVGTVWECAANSYAGYPTTSQSVEKDFTDAGDVPWRGGAYGNDSTYVRCGARVRFYPIYGYYNYGFRIVVAPRAH